MSKKITTEDFKKQVFEIYEEEWEVVGEYINAKSKIKIRHKCGEKFERHVATVLRGKMMCSCMEHPNKKSNEQFLKELYEVHGEEYAVLTKYDGDKNSVKVRHNCKECGNYEWYTTPASILVGSGCPKCANVLRKTTEQFKKEVCDLVGEEFIILGEYLNHKTPIHMKHIKCNREFYIRPDNFKNRCRCPLCAEDIRIIKRMKTQKEFEDEIYEMHKEEYSVVGEYKGIKEYVKVRHNKCGYEWDTLPGNFLAGNRCPRCKNLNNSGENSPSWKGGITPLHNYLRESINQWKSDSFRISSYRCALTGENKKILIHHLKGFNEILRETLSVLNLDLKSEISLYTKEELDLIKKKCIELHYSYGYGVTINSIIHNLFHLKELYGRGNNTKEQFEKFVYRLKQGEFNDFLEKENLKLNINYKVLNELLK